MWGAIIQLVGNTVGGAQAGAQAQYAGWRAEQNATTDYYRSKEYLAYSNNRILLIAFCALVVLGLAVMFYALKKTS